MERPLLARMAMGLRTIAPDRQFYSDVSTRLMEALSGGLRDVFPTGPEAEANLRRSRLRGSVMRDAPDAKDDALREAYREKLTNLGLAGLTVYHGTPHSFDKFDMSKIGTGEGAQAYGHGLYFAENPGVAKTYNPNPGIAADAHRKSIKFWEKDLTSSNPAYVEKAKKEIAALNEKLANQDGALYKVDLPDDQIAKMLDWDKPLSQQPQVVQDMIKQAHELRRRQTGAEFTLDMNMRGSDLIPTIGEGRLKQVGIPGIRYLDQGSRAGGKGTSNFVVFDDALPKIIGRE